MIMFVQTECRGGLTGLETIKGPYR